MNKDNVMDFQSEDSKQSKKYVFDGVANESLEWISTYQTYAFTIISSWGNKYNFILYDSDRIQSLQNQQNPRKKVKSSGPINNYSKTYVNKFFLCV